MDTDKFNIYEIHVLIKLTLWSNYGNEWHHTEVHDHFHFDLLNAVSADNVGTFLRNPGDAILYW